MKHSRTIATLQAMIRSAFLATLLAACALSSTAIAQSHVDLPPLPPSRVLAGPVVGFSYNRHAFGFRVINSEEWPIADPAQGFGVMAGISGEYRFDEEWGVMATLGYASRPGEMSQPVPDANVMWLTGADTADRRDVIIEISTAQQYVALDLAGTWRAFHFRKYDRDRGNFIGLFAGISVSYPLQGTFTEALKLDPSEPGEFNDPGGAAQGRNIVFALDEPIPGMRSFGFGAIAGLFADIGLVRGVRAIPSIQYDYPLTASTQWDDWHLSALDLRLAIHWTLAHGELEEEAPRY